MSDVKATFLKNGPIQIKEPIELHDGATGEPIPAEKFPVYLCRCGLSQNKPFCDGQHSKEGFDGTCARQHAGS